MKKKCWVWFLAVLSCLLASPVWSMVLEVQDNTVFATGGVEGNEWNKLRDILDSHRIERVVFVNSPGGDLWTGMRVGRLIAERNIQTVVAGRCVSACSIMFMGGSERRFSDAFAPAQTYVGIHGPHSKLTKQVDASQAGQIYAFFALRMGDRFNDDLIKTALFEMDDAGALLYVYDPKRSPAKAPVHCRSEQMPMVACAKLAGNNALSMGLVTATDLVSVTLPPSMLEVPRIPGGLLQGSPVDAATLYPELAKQQCVTEACSKAVTGFAAQKDSRAMAFPLQGSGYGGSWGQDSASRAFLSAIYFCNHIKDKPARLCQVRVVNGQDVQGDAQLSVAEHAKALGALQRPQDRFYGNEQYGGGFTQFSELRTEKFTDATPQELPQVKTVGTQELAGWLTAPERPVVIDVSLSDSTLPTAASLVYGGHAMLDPGADAQLAKRIDALLQLLAPDRGRPLVIVGLDRQDWRSVNASVRASRAGYSNVAWYRGGLAAWKAANLPTARANFQAVAN